MTERWKAVLGSEGAYEVSDFGRVRSLDRVIDSFAPSARGYPKRVRGKMLKPQLHSGGYLQAGLGLDVGTRLIHVLVLEAFVGPAPAGAEGSHVDGCKANCCLTNLQWETHQSNVDRRVVHGTNPVGERNGMRVLTEQEAREIRRRAESGEPYASIAADFPTSDRNVGKIARRERWTHV